MSHFYSNIWGGRGEATRCGHKSTGINAVAKNWYGKIKIRGEWEEPIHPACSQLGSDKFEVSFEFLENSYLKDNPSVRGHVPLVTLRYNPDQNQWHIEHHVGEGHSHNVTAKQAEFNFVNTLTTHSY